MDRILIPIDDGMIPEHFRDAVRFKYYYIVDHEPADLRLLDASGQDPAALLPLLRENQVNTIVCAGISRAAEALFQAAGVQVLGGVTGRADHAVRAIMQGYFTHTPGDYYDD